ncbi:probable long-chain-alcohol O-fatty-acyltransferase 5 [Herrania umbratica]|uniref:Probable long-chain-alcohol O-fatty-acyltransferase 5 n=1 Tax=Herrania umbratica TaxID=108875 RepID=A0A6J1AM74_9ROSI|nr:probable long-chain-alcohol O-fatty-acyltransferase 5 [Herrania umbratica]
MEGELKNFISVIIMALISMYYCYYIAAMMPKGLPRLISLLPVITLFSVLPFNVHSFHIGAPVVFILGWITNFKLLLLAFDQGPLSPPPPGAHLFILTACSPFRIKQSQPKAKRTTGPNVVSEAANKAALLALLFHCYNYRQCFPGQVLLILYFFHTYLTIQFFLAVAAIPALILLGVELEPQFNGPLLATSLQDFWGRRWNLRVSDTLRPTVYNPIRSVSTRIIGPRWASLPAVFATFLTSGLMHELIYYHITREFPTWEVTWFFVLQGFFVDVEIVLKKKFLFRLHRSVSGPLALANLAVTAGWLSYRQLLRNKVDEKVINEFNAFLEFLRRLSMI